MSRARTSSSNGISGEGRNARYAELVGEVIRRQPDLILTDSTRLALHLEATTSTIPIVGAPVADPLAFGLVTSPARPGGNITGTIPDAGVETEGKRLQFLRKVGNAENTVHQRLVSRRFTLMSTS